MGWWPIWNEFFIKCFYDLSDGLFVLTKGISNFGNKKKNKDRTGRWLNSVWWEILIKIIYWSIYLEGLICYRRNTIYTLYLSVLKTISVMTFQQLDQHIWSKSCWNSTKFWPSHSIVTGHCCSFAHFDSNNISTETSYIPAAKERLYEHI